jgi:hypothetical protein
MKCYLLIVFGFLAMSSIILHSEVLELGTSDVRGARDQPQALTILSRAKTEDSVLLTPWRAVDKIKEEIKNDIFLSSSNE